MCQGTYTEAASSAADAASADKQFDEDLEAAEEQLTLKVPALLDTMNRSSTEANELETRAGAAHRRYKTGLAEWTQLYERLRLKQGHAFSRIKPYYFANQELKASSHHVQTVAREYSEATQEHERALELLHSTEVERLKEERDRLEEQYAQSLSEYQAAQKVLGAQRASLGDDMISRALPHFEMLQERQMCLAIEHNRINTLVERARAARCTYRHSMDELEKISESVHNMRCERSRSTSP